MTAFRYTRLVGMAAFGLGFGIFASLMLHKGGVFRQLEPHQPGECRPVAGIVGGEDLQWRPNGREVFVAAQDRRNVDEPGHIYRLDVRQKDPGPADVTPELDFPFHPHGLHLYADSRGRETLFVVNHRGGWAPPHTIEIFDVTRDGTLSHRRSVADPAFVSPNDVVAVGPEQFYITNDHGFSARSIHTLEDFLLLGLGDVVFFDGTSSRVVYEGTYYANGINVSADGGQLYLAETTGATIKVFERDRATNDLRLNQTVRAHTGVDNIDVAADGSLWVGAHPNMFAFLAHMSDPQKRSPSQVLRLAADDGGTWRYEEVYLDDGDPLSGSATAATMGNTMVVGPVFDPHVLACTL
jgi:arylesterase / paraoxonase